MRIFLRVCASYCSEYESMSNITVDRALQCITISHQNLSRLANETVVLNTKLLYIPFHLIDFLGFIFY